MSIKIPEFLTILAGASIELKTEITPENATNKKVYWSSNKPSVASVNDNGKVTAKSAGWAVISAIPESNLKLWSSCVVYVPYTGKDDINPPLFCDPHGPYDFWWGWVFDDVENIKNITSGYDRNRGSLPYHWAIDIADNYNSKGELMPMKDREIKSPTFGKVVKIYKNGDNGYGNSIVIETENIDPITKKNIRILFAHMRDNPNDRFKIDDPVVPGSLIGNVGNTGLSVGNGGGHHLHLAMFNDVSNYEKEGNSINPQRFFPNITFTGDTEPWCTCDLHIHEYN